MKRIPVIKFQRDKYGDVLLVDVVTLDAIRKSRGFQEVLRQSFYGVMLTTGGFGLVAGDGRHQGSLFGSKGEFVHFFCGFFSGLRSTGGQHQRCRHDDYQLLHSYDICCKETKKPQHGTYPFCGLFCTNYLLRTNNPRHKIVFRYFNAFTGHSFVHL